MVFKITLLALFALFQFTLGAPTPDQGGFVAVRNIIQCQTKEVIAVNEDSMDAYGCLVGPCGEKVCPIGAIGADGKSRVTFRKNQGPGQTGSNGNAAPINEQGVAVDPAAVTYLKQIEAYKKWELQQLENNKKIIG
ncbi:uncharacterized protein [Lepeophtheirus salmonis]|nr:uncharacterized protein LOC121123320 [Lepeophtheirus salmonis]XP_040574418.1 uncharacterized protein LOC121123365 [Lepeophtheirus salmonis]